MSVQVQGNGGTIVEVDGTTFRGLRTVAKPIEYGALGHYRMAARSGAVTGTSVAAGSPLFSFRWGDATRFAVVTYLKAAWAPTVLFTAQQELGLDAVIARAFTASDSAGTALTLTGNNQKMRTSMGTTLLTDARIAAATLLTAGTRTVDAQAFVAGGGLVNQVNAAAGTAYINPSFAAQPYGFEWFANVDKGEHPIVLAQNEGVLVRNTVVFPAAGTAVLNVSIAWAEVSAY